MKKSPIYLGALAGILAIAAAFTTKGHTRVASYTAKTKACQNLVTTACPDVSGAKCHSAFGSTLRTKTNCKHTILTHA